MFAAEPTGVSVNTITRNTEINRGDHFVNKIKNTHRFVAETKQWHVYGQGVWAPVELKRVQGEALEFIKSQAELIAKIPDERDRADATNEYRAYAKKAGISNLTDLASIKLIENIDKFDSDDLAMCMNTVVYCIGSWCRCVVLWCGALQNRRACRVVVLAMPIVCV